MLSTQTAAVADRIYYDQPEVSEFSASVKAIRELARVNGQQVWQIALDRTAFYPTGGGQPCDIGMLVAVARSGAVLEVPVIAVEEDDAGEVWHTTSKPLQEGAAVQGRIDRERRQDHTQQHSGQHLLSAILLRDLGAKTVGFHLGAELSTIDLAGPLLTDEVLARVESAVNLAVQSALPVSVRNVSSEESKRLLAEGRLQKLPPREGALRLVEIAGVDLTACGGTHFSSTAAIGPVLLRGTKRVRDTTRLSFLCGGRALHAARADYLLLRSLAASLSTGTGEIAGRVARLQAENRTFAKVRKAHLKDGCPTSRI